MRTLRIAILTIGLAALAMGCSKKKDPAAPAPDTATEPAADGAGDPAADAPADPCAGGEADPCAGGE